MTELVLGFDPGGQDAFGWCVAQLSEGRLHVERAGIGPSARAVSRAVVEACAGRVPAGIGIDAPMFWPRDGGRSVDTALRAALTRRGVPNTSGTVQHINSLRGACLAQAVLLVDELRAALGDVRITEAHPKALAFLLGKTENGHAQPADPLTYMTAATAFGDEHQRDAAFSALAAARMVGCSEGWRDYAATDEPKYLPAGPVEYWLPSLA